MSALLFLAGFEGGTQPKEVTKYISDAFKKNKVLQLWVDPDSKARAVALLKKEIGAEEIVKLGEVKLHDKFILTEPTKPVESVFVKHNEDEELCFGMQDKLKYLFSSHRHIGCTVNKVKQLSSVSWEVYFMDGWEAVLQACSHSWEEQRLEVIPYFKCFKEDIEEQLKRILSQDEKIKEGKHDKGTTKDKQQQPGKKSHDSSSKGVWDLQWAALQPLPKPETSSTDESDQEMEVDMASHDEEVSPHTASVGRKQKKDSLNQSEAGKQIKVSKVVFHHDFVWKFLIMLQFEKTVKGMFPKLEIESDDGDAVIKGEDGSVEIVEKMLQQANLKVTKKLERLLHQDQQIRQDLLHECDEFLSRTHIQEELVEYINEEGLSIVFHEADGKFSVMVALDKDSKKMPFPEFVSSQVGVKECLSLPDEKFEDDSKWLNFVASSNKKYPLIHISVINKSVFLLWLTCCGSAGSDTVAKKITNFMEKLDAPVSDDSAVASVTKDDGSVSESGKSKKKSKTKVSIVGLSPFLVWVMNALKMKEAAENVFENSTVYIDEEEGEIDVSGRKEDVDALKAFLMSLNKKNSLSDEVEDFLNCRPVQQNLKSYLTAMKLEIKRGPCISMSVLHKNFKKENVEEFIKNLVKKEDCKTLPLCLKYNSEWLMLLQSVHEEHSLLHVFVVDDKVSVLTLATQDSPKTAAVIGKINGFIESKTDKLSETSTDTKQQSYHFSASLHKNKFHVSLSFPGLVQFLGSHDGKKLVKQLQDQHSCIISYIGNNRSQSGMQLDRQEATEDSAGLQYKVAMLATARGRDFNIHLIQGEMHDLDVEMRITLHSSSKVSECSIKNEKSTKELKILLPPWQAPDGVDCHEHFGKLRRSLRSKCVTLMFQQAEHLKWPPMAISTKDALSAEHPFPADDLAQAITEELCMMFETSNSANGASSKFKTFDLYICEPEKEAIFSAFSFHLKKNLSLGPPDQDSWDKICYAEPCTFKDLVDKYNVEVTDIYKQLDSQMHKTLFCYPIHGSLELNTFPACRETYSVPQNLKFSIRHLQKEYGGDGPIDGEVVPLKLYSYRNECVICCPEWGMGCQQVISDALKTFLYKGKDCETVRIVPPGMHTFPQYPKQFLAQAVFRELDELFKNNWSLRHTKIVIAVEDSDYRKAFEKELQKRKPKQEEQKWFSGIRNWWQDSKPGNKSKGSVEKVLKSSVPSTTVTIASTSNDIGEKAARELEKELEKLMAHNTVTRTLSNKETEELKNIVMDMQDVEVQITVETQYKTKGTGHKRGKQNKKESDKLVPAGAVVTVKGLREHNVREFMSMATGQPSESGHKTAAGWAKTHEHGDQSRNYNDEQKEMQGRISSSKGRTTSATPKLFEGDENKIKESNSESKLPHKKVEDTRSTFTWLYEARLRNGAPIFQYYEEDICTWLEDAYRGKVKNQQMKMGGPFLKVDFLSMTVEVITGKVAGIIHTEMIEEDLSDPLPSSWHLQVGQTVCVREVEKDTDIYKGFQYDLKECLSSQMSLIKVQCIENARLYRRTEVKKRHLARPSEIRMWHRVKQEYKDAICEYGFHPLFSAMPEVKHLGEGVLFYRDAEKCISPTERQEEIFLVYSRVYSGKMGPGHKKLRYAPFNHDGGHYDSAEEEASVMLFSDAQAYPLYLITLSVKRR